MKPFANHHKDHKWRITGIVVTSEHYITYHRCSRPNCNAIMSKTLSPDDLKTDI